MHIIKFSNGKYYERLDSNDTIIMNDDIRKSLQFSREGIAQELESGRLDTLDYKLIFERKELEKSNFYAIQMFPTGTQHLIDDGLHWYGSGWWLDHGHDTEDNVIQTELHNSFDDEGDGDTGLVVALSFTKLKEEDIKILNILNVKQEHIDAMIKAGK